MLEQPVKSGMLEVQMRWKMADAEPKSASEVPGGALRRT